MKHKKSAKTAAKGHKKHHKEMSEKELKKISGGRQPYAQGSALERAAAEESL